MLKNINIIKSNVHTYLLVMTVWERQEGAKTALKGINSREKSIGSCLNQCRICFYLTENRF